MTFHSETRTRPQQFQQRGEIACYHARPGLRIVGAFMACLALLAVSPSALADTHYVSKTGLHAPPCTCWADASSTIQGAIDVTTDGDTVLVGLGTYTGLGNHDIDYGGRRIAVTAVNGAYSTTIDCQGGAAEPHRGFRFHTGEDGGSVLTGFQIRGGYAPFDVRDNRSFGGAIVCDSGASPTIAECLFVGNFAGDMGGAIALVASSCALVRDCAFVDNHCHNIYSGPEGGLGGAIVCFDAAPLSVRSGISSRGDCRSPNRDGFGHPVQTSAHLSMI